MTPHDTSPNAPVRDHDHQSDVEELLERLPRWVSRSGVLHVGAHQGQEVAAYLRAGFARVLLVEANPKWYNFLRDTFKNEPRVSVYQYAVSDTEGEIDLMVHTSQSGSTEPASILPMKRFKEIIRSLHTPEILRVPAITLDTFFISHQLQPGDVSLLNLDIQGAEWRALAGGRTVIPSLQAVICEVNLIELYDGAALEEQVVAFFTERGFRRETAIYHTLYDEQSRFPAWGESLFIKQGAAPTASGGHDDHPEG